MSQGGRAARMEAYRTWCEAGPCVDCGCHFRYWVMTADHTADDKLDNPSRVARNGSMQRLMDELDKCERVCANCHHDRTYRRTQPLDGAGAGTDVGGVRDGID
jgi:hypothetical protein